MIDWTENLVYDLARRRAVIVIGSGVSRHSIGTGGARPPTWRTFLQAALRDCPDQNLINHVQEAIETGDYLHACEWLKKRYDEEWVPYLRKTFSQPEFKPAEIHNEVLLLDTRILFSLNFDDIYERHAVSTNHGTDIIKNYYDTDVSEFLRGKERYTQ